MSKITFAYIRDGNSRPRREDQRRELVNFSGDKMSFFCDSSDGEVRSGFDELISVLEKNKGATLLLYDYGSVDFCYKTLNSFIEFLVYLERNEIALKVLWNDSPPLNSATAMLLIYNETTKHLHKEHIQNSLMKRKESGQNIGRPSKRDDKKIVELRRRGLTYREISQALRISIGAVQRGLVNAEN